jgi:hypothetical protein
MHLKATGNDGKTISNGSQAHARADSTSVRTTERDVVRGGRMQTLVLEDAGQGKK